MKLALALSRARVKAKKKRKAGKKKKRISGPRILWRPLLWMEGKQGGEIGEDGWCKREREKDEAFIQINVGWVLFL